MAACRRTDLKLTKSDRQSRIIAELRTTPTLRVNELAALLNVSTETVRRDLAELDERGLINRTYGGAMRPVSFEPALAEREKLMVAERERIAAAAVKPRRGQRHPDDRRRRHDDDLRAAAGGGARSPHRHHPCLLDRHGARQPTRFHKVLMLPGQYDSREGLIHGPDTIEALQRYRASKAFLGASGLTAEGPSDAGVGPGLIYGAMMKRAARNGDPRRPHEVRPPFALGLRPLVATDAAGLRP